MKTIPYIPTDLAPITDKVTQRQRITSEEALTLWEKGSLPLLGWLATSVKQAISEDYVYFNKNIHIEPTNVCVFKCKFCSFRRDTGEEGSWEYSIEEVKEKVLACQEKKITEVHITGGVHPDRPLTFLEEMLQTIKKTAPEIHIKAFTAVEIHYWAKREKISYEECLKRLIAAGLDSLPGGGAEIFDPKLRTEMRANKTTGAQWLEIHKVAHRLGLKTNATMLYGLLDKYEHRVDHLNLLRELQDETGGFNTFIPLKFRHANNEYSHVTESTIIEDLKNYAISRIFLDNFAHVKAYWPMIGKETARLALHFGVDDLDGTIDDTTKIYTMAGSEEQTPTMTTNELVTTIQQEGRVAVERDTLYNPQHIYQ